MLWRNSRTSVAAGFALTAAVGEDEEVEELSEGGERWRRLKNVETQLVKYHPWTKAIATTVV